MRTRSSRFSARCLVALGLVAVGLALSACGSASMGLSSSSALAPLPSFTVAPGAPMTGQLVQFTDTSTGSPTSWAWTFGDGSSSTAQSPTHTFSTTGAFTVSLTTTNAAGSATSQKSVTVTTSVRYTLADSLSDEAQRTTLAFAGLGLMTGNLDSQSFFPPGKVADYTGFQYLRDNDPDDMGHNTSFLTRIANNVIFILSDAQFAQLETLAASQQDEYFQYRLPALSAHAGVPAPD